MSYLSMGDTRNYLIKKASNEKQKTNCNKKQKKMRIKTEIYCEGTGCVR